MEVKVCNAGGYGYVISINQILFMCHLCMHTTSLKRLMRHNVQRGISLMVGIEIGEIKYREWLYDKESK